MPFRKIIKGKDKGKYKSPTGRVFTDKQVKLYYSTNGFDKKKMAERLLLKGMRGDKK